MSFRLVLVVVALEDCCEKVMEKDGDRCVWMSDAGFVVSLAVCLELLRRNHVDCGTEKSVRVGSTRRRICARSRERLRNSF